MPFLQQKHAVLLKSSSGITRPSMGVGLDIAEIELSMLQRQYLDRRNNRRIPDQETLKREVAACERERNQHAVKANGRFTTEDARIKLNKLYP
jgi:predicted nucleotidyltransferase